MKQHWKKIHLDNILGHFFVLSLIVYLVLYSIRNLKHTDTHFRHSPVTIHKIQIKTFGKLVYLFLFYYVSTQKSDENVVITAVVISSAEHDKKRNWFLRLWSHRVCLHWVKCMRWVHSSLIPYDCVIKRSTVSDRLFDCTQLFQFNIPHELYRSVKQTK